MRLPVINNEVQETHVKTIEKNLEPVWNMRVFYFLIEKNYSRSNLLTHALESVNIHAPNGRTKISKCDSIRPKEGRRLNCKRQDLNQDP